VTIPKLTHTLQVMNFLQLLRIWEQAGVAVDAVVRESNVINVGRFVDEESIVMPLDGPTPRLLGLYCQSFRFDTRSVTAIVGMVRAEKVVFELDSVQLVEPGLVQYRVTTHEMWSVVATLVDLVESREQTAAVFALRFQVKGHDIGNIEGIA
jgi:hypothetical protein